MVSHRSAPAVIQKVVVDGKHLSLAGAPYRVRGATYGSFVPRADGQLFPEPDQLRRDLHDMAREGLNALRTYTVPPRELLDGAAEEGLHVLVGLHYPDWREELVPGRFSRRRILDAGRRSADEAMALCAGNPAVLALSVGNEVPADVVRVHGIGAVEDTLGRMVEHLHAADPDLLVTYCNYPSTEYLTVPGLDLLCFNVFLEDQAALRRYLRHLQLVALEKPLVISELGLAGDLHGATGQADALRWQLQTVDETGCAGATVFSWTDDWGVAGQRVDGWGFGVTDAERRAKPGLEVVSRWARSSLKDLRESWPSMSVVVCAYNEEATIDECLRSLTRCDYPDLEVIVCDDGSTDATMELALPYGSFGFKVLDLPHGGLSVARNAGLQAATGELVAYLDADAYCHPEWPYHLALSLEEPNVVATGGPNLAVPGGPLIERAVAASPGAPVEVLITDDRAEHVPGCNMAFRRAALEEIDGFDPVYSAAGDDVDVCWKLADRGYEIGFSAAAQVRHHRRATIRSFLRQQRGYGRAERMLSGPHRHRFNRIGQARWRGAIYTRHVGLASILRPVVYHGWQGSAAYQPVARRRHQSAWEVASSAVPLIFLFGVFALGVGVRLRPGLIVAAAAAGVLALFAVAAGAGVTPERTEPDPLTLRLLVAFLNLAQPLARLAGRLRGRPVDRGLESRPPWTGERLDWLQSFERQCAALGCMWRRGPPHAGWDLEIWRGPLVKCRFSAAVVWHWTPVHRCRLRPRLGGLLLAAAAVVLAILGPPAALAAPMAISVATAFGVVQLRRDIRCALARTVPVNETATVDAIRADR